MEDPNEAYNDFTEEYSRIRQGINGPVEIADSVNTLQTIVPNLNENARVFTQIITELA